MGEDIDAAAMGCTSCSGQGGGKRKYKRMRGGAMLSLSPASLSSSDSFDRAGNSLANAAHKLYVEQNYELAALKNQNVMMGGRRKKSKTAKKYRSKSKSKKQRGGILELGAFINEAAVPFTLLAAQQKYKTRGTKGYKGNNGRKSRKFRGSRRRR
jgi:hypothetical protein